jgi:uncharacterized protein YjbJ (UPF0337 family)
MGSTTDKIKGRAKEAVGVISDNDSLKREGQTDQAVGEVKEAAEKVSVRHGRAETRGVNCSPKTIMDDST